MLVTDNYLRRSYSQLQEQLRPDTVFFLGDLFDGGREWNTGHGDFKDPEWSHRPENEQKYAKKWKKKYGENYWLQEYARFGDIFLNPWTAIASSPSPGQRGRKLIASLPGNHDLGFGSEVNVGVRNRFETYFGDANRVDVIGNHTIVSVDTVSLSADTSDQVASADLRSIYKPTEHFLNNVQWTKRKAVAKELRFLRGEIEEVKQRHRIEDVEKADFANQPTLDPGENAPELPTILLTHVPLYRPPGTPCGPLREHWPPTKPPKGQTDPVIPDHRNAISVARGYQYQNVLSEIDSVKIIKSVGNVVHVFSGDDHDYCEVVHSSSQSGVREITVKSISMAMGVPTPGFLMVSLHNPIDSDGRPLASGQATLKTHLCLLPRQLSTYSTYGCVVLFCLALIALRAFLVPVLNLTRFALDPIPGDGGGAGLPVFKAKLDDYDEYGFPSAGYSASRFQSSSSSSSNSKTRGRSQSFTPATGKPDGHRGPADPSSAPPKGGKSRHSKGPGRWGWGGGSGSSRGLKIEIRNDDDFYGGGKWRPASARSRSPVNVILRELWSMSWRVGWMVGLLWLYLAWKG